jgi:hypothetical protein
MQPTKRERLAAMRLEDFKAHLRTIAGEDPKAKIAGAPRPHRLLVRKRPRSNPHPISMVRTDRDFHDMDTSPGRVPDKVDTQDACCARRNLASID